VRTKGDRVVQPTYGPGTLVEVNEHHTVIEFDEHAGARSRPARRSAGHERTCAGQGCAQARDPQGGGGGGGEKKKKKK